MMISDSIVLTISTGGWQTWQGKIKALRTILAAVEKIQYKCALENIWLRGGVSIGAAHHEENILGRPYIEAYELEKQAVFPRIIVIPKIIGIFDGNTAPKTRAALIREVNEPGGEEQYKQKYLYDGEASGGYFKNDVPFFVHFLRAISSNSEEQKKVLEHLRKRLYSEDPVEYPKYRWVAEYLAAFLDKKDSEKFSTL